ncbi:cobyric acid synthase CobQ [Paenibacillus curdlanolyticus YK9]|uniref:Cobyric acid synthase n=1 Tax=Paenibacillus curdlanolyticus YK9 TaxID=717606 RepID=E0I5L2_9BACL|nr:cobyric acid synthase [Paenibacillus curdlanolyticus]EFM12254.1 cobyric acid synthase CobQ [Paenibacillus curdlanolyticus YK9]
MQRAKTVMVQGTSSDVGKSVLTTALCRILRQDGWKVAPYKSQNMALNSYVTLDGKEIGRAQGVQAEACGIAATTDMNPILIKPTRDMTAQIVVHGKPHQEMSATRYREEYLPLAADIVVAALERLRAQYDVVALEGAGSPAEINLKSRDIVNMRMAGWADAPVLLVADIDKGGVFAAIVGTLELLEEHERQRVKGFVINKFRGDISLLQPGLDWLEERTGIPVLGVIPHLPRLDIEAEDSVVLERSQRSDDTGADAEGKELDVAVIRLPRISNFTDFDPLSAEPDVALRYVEGADQLQQPDIMILPGSKNTLDDLSFLRESGLAEAIDRLVISGCTLVGICGGYQMLGRKLNDPLQVESECGEAVGLGYLPLETTFYEEKRTERVIGTVVSKHHDWNAFIGTPVSGYEIHMGQTKKLEPVQSLFSLGNREDGAISEDGRVWGTYVHGIFHADAFRRQWLDSVRTAKGLEPIRVILPFSARQDEAFDRLAAHVRNHLDIDKLYEIIGLEK